MDVTIAADGSAIRVRFNADSADTGYAQLDVTHRVHLYRYDAYATASVWSVQILADDGADVLESQMVGLASGAGISGDLTGEIDTGLGYRALTFGPGRYMVMVTTDAAASGEAVIWTA